MEKVFITGASGLLGSNIICELIANNYSVVALVRNKKKLNFEASDQLKIVEGEIGNRSLLSQLLQDSDYLIHSAAQTKQGLSNYSDYTDVNVDLTRILLEEAVKNKIKRFIYISTANVFGYGSKTKPGDETMEARKPYSDSFYVRSKIEAQNLVLSYANRLKVVCLNPTFLIGAYGYPEGSCRIVLMGYRKKLIFYPPGGKNFIDVKDAAKATHHALKNGRNGESFLLAGENLTYKEFFTRMNTQALMVKIPGFVLLALGLVGSFLKTVHVSTEMTLINMRILCIKNFYSNKKAHKQLCINFNPIDTAIGDSVRWFKQKGVIKDKS